jgi:integrase
MPNVRFYLDSKADKQGEQRIMYSFTYQGKQMRKATGIKLKPKFFSMKKQVILDSCGDAKTLNDRLTAIKQTANDMFVELQVKGTLNEHHVNEKLHEAVRGKKYEATFWGYFEKFIAVHELTRKKDFAKSRRSTLRFLQKFENETGYTISFETLNMTFYQRFQDYCISLQNSNNTIAGRVRNLKAALNWCKKQGVKIHPDVEYFQAKWEETNHIALALADLQALEKLDLEDNTRLQNVRDMFLLGSYTGLRYSDLSRLRTEHITGETITINIEKTSDILSIPIIPQARRILDRYPYVNFRRISQQKFNDYIKEVCKMAGFNENVIRTYRTGTKTIEKIQEKWECVASHTMRRTFVTVSHSIGMDDHTIMKITGHKNYQNFKKYLKLTQITVQREAVEKWGLADTAK